MQSSCLRIDFTRRLARISREPSSERIIDFGEAFMERAHVESEVGLGRGCHPERGHDRKRGSDACRQPEHNGKSFRRN
jgi:hypothetical protein